MLSFLFRHKKALQQLKSKLSTNTKSLNNGGFNGDNQKADYYSGTKFDVIELDGEKIEPFE